METVSFIHMAASAGAAACMAELLTLPIDTAKVRMQVATVPMVTGAQAVQKSIGFVPVLAQMVRDEGITAWWKGLPAGLQRQFIYATLRISMYPHLRDFIGNQKVIASVVPDLGVKVLAGMSAGAIGMTIANPTDVVKVRLQSAITAAKEGSEAARSAAARNPQHTVYNGSVHAYFSIIREEGVFGLWRGLGPNIVRNAIVCAAEMVAYDELKRMCLQYVPNGLGCHCVAGFGAGFMATVIGSPVDVVKTRYMNARPGEYRGVGQCLLSLARTAGPRGFYRGFIPNVLRMGCFNMLVFVLYEQILSQLNSRTIS